MSSTLNRPTTPLLSAGRLRKPDWLLIFIAAIPFWSAISMWLFARDIGRPFDGVLSSYDAVNSNFTVSEFTPLWWTNAASGALRSRDLLIAVNGVPYRESVPVFVEAAARSQPTVSMTIQRNGHLSDVAVTLGYATWNKFFDIRLPGLVICICSWLAGLVVYRADPTNPLNRLVTLLYMLFAAVFASDRGYMLSQEAGYFPFTDFAGQVFIILEGAVIVHFAFYLSQEGANTFFSRTFIKVYYLFAIIVLGLEVTAEYLLLTQGDSPTALQVYWIYSIPFNFMHFIPPLLVITRLAWFLFRTRENMALYRVRRMAYMLILGLVLAMPDVVLSPVARFIDPELHHFVQYFDMRYLLLFAPVLSAGAILRYQMFRTRSFVLLIVPVIAVAGLASSFITAVFLSIQPTFLASEIVTPFLPSFFIILVVSLLWLYQTSWRGAFGRFMYGEKSHYRDVGLFGRGLIQQGKIVNPPQAIAVALRDQYDLDYVAVWMWHEKRWVGEEHEGQFILATQVGFPLQINAEAINVHWDEVCEFLTQPLVRPDRHAKLIPASFQSLLQHPTVEVIVPMSFADRPIGLLVISKRRDQEILDEQDVQALTLFAQQSILFLEAMRQKAQFERVSNTLHDTTQQFFYQLNFELTTILDGLQQNNPMMQTHLNRLIGDVMDNSDALRDIISGKFVRDLDDLQEMLETFQRRHALPILYNIEARPDIPITLQNEAYLWVKEALNNIVKHANAHLLTISLCYENDELTLFIRDNGCGVGQEKTKSKQLQHRGGLNRMRERVESFNGSFTYHATESTGTEITIRIPLKMLT